MHKKTKAHVSKGFMTKLLLVLLLLAILAFAAVMARNHWLHVNIEQTNSKQQIVALEKKLELLLQNMHTVSANTPVDIHAYTMAQVKDAYLLVRTAHISLQQDQDVVVAKRLMQMAYEHLANLQGAKIEQARKIIAADQAKLDAVHQVDRRGVQEKLDTLDKLVNVLPPYKVATNDQPTNTSTKTKAAPAANKMAWYQEMSNMFSGIKTVVKVRKKTEREINLADLDVARAQFKLIIEQLRWAAFYNNASVYQRSIKNAQELLPDLFDAQSESVQKFGAILQELQKIQLRPEVPNIQDSVNAVQAILVG